MMFLQYILASLGVSKVRHRQRGATLIEYVLIVAVIAVAVFTADSFGLVDAITGLFKEAADEINSA